MRPQHSVARQAEEHGERLWERGPDRCCALRKVEPLSRALAGLDAWITSVRRDQTTARAAAAVVEHDARFELVKISPLVEWTSDDVWSYLRRHDVPFNPLHLRGYPSVGCWPCDNSKPGTVDRRSTSHERGLARIIHEGPESPPRTV